MRLIAVAEELEARRLSPRFVVGGNLEGVEHMLENYNYPVTAVDGPVQDRRVDEDKYLISDMSPSTMVTDLFHPAAMGAGELLATYHEQLPDLEPTICFTGRQILNLPADIVINPYVSMDNFAETVDKGSKTEKVLAGPDYFVFRLGCLLRVPRLNHAAVKPRMSGTI
jgi:hypothetical protein